MRTFAAFFALLALSSTVAGAQDAPAPAVTVVAIEFADITPSTGFTGRIEAIDKVELIARVDGFLEAKPFTEGGRVEKGDLLFAIEKAPYEAQLGEVQAEIAAAEAEVKLAELEVERQRVLVQREAAAQAVLDRVTAEAGKAEAALQRARASTAVAELNLSYTDIRAPFAGRIGRSAPSVGDYVRPDSGTLAVLVSQDPIYVTFPVTERQIIAFRRRAAQSGEDESSLAIKVQLADGSLYEHVGTIDFVDVIVDTGTDTVTVRAVVPNPDGFLIDQQLVQALVEAADPVSALLVPQAATLADQGGRYVLVVDADNTVEQRSIEVGESVDGKFVVTNGLEAGERVITEGIQRVRPGMVVDPGPAGNGA